MRWRTTAALLLLVAAVAAVARSAGAGAAGRAGGVVAALVLVWVAAGVHRARPWALGSAFLVALCWLWATVALRVHDAIGAGEAALWIAWSLAVIAATVMTRTP